MGWEGAVMDAGRDVVVVISPAQSAQLLLAQARRARTASCPLQGPAGIAFWPTHARLEQEPGGPVALIDGETSLSDEPVDDYREPLDDELRAVRPEIFRVLAPLAAQIGSEVEDVGFRVVGDGALAVGVDLWGGVLQDDAARTAWSTFDVDFRRGHDWALFVDRRLLVPVIERAARRAGRALPFLLEDVEVVWADPITVRLTGRYLTGFGAFGWWHELAVTVEVQIDFEVNARAQLSLRRRRASLRLDGVGAQIAGWAYGDEIRTALRENIDPDQVFPPVTLSFALPPLARLTGTDAVISADGLVIHGDMTVALPTPPRLEFSPRRLVFLETVNSACSVGGPTFEDQTVYLRNTGGSPLFLCSVATAGGFTIVETSDPTITVAADGQSLRLPDGGIDRTESLAVTVRYAGPRGDQVDSSLMIVCNDPSDMRREVALTVPPSRPLSWTTDPTDVLEISVANSRPDEEFRTVSDCREIVRRSPESLQRPAGEVRVHNTGRATVVLCGISILSDRFEVVEPPSRRIEPGGSLTIGIRYFPTQVGATDESALDVFDQDGQRRSVRIRAHVVPEAQRARLDLSVTGDLIDVLIDLAGDRLCLPHDGDICRARPFFADVPEGEVPYAVVRIGPVPPDAEVRLTDDAGRPVAVDVSDRRHREFLLPWTDGDGFTGNPCIARFDTLSAAELAAVRIGLSGQVLHRVATFPGPMRSYVALTELVAVLDDRGVTLLDWRDQDSPRRVGAIPLTEAVGLTAAGSHLVVLSASEVAMLELGGGNEPTVSARGEIDAGEPFACSDDCLAVARTDTAVLYTLDDGPIRVAHSLQLPFAPTQLAFSARRLVIAGGSEVVLLSRDGDVLATWIAADPIEDLVASGRSIWVRSRTMDTRLEATGDELLPVSSATRAHRVPAFGPAPQPGRLLHHTNDNQLDLWAVSRHQLRRDRFKEAFTMRTQSLRPDHHR
jgi:hypothetical protein